MSMRYRRSIKVAPGLKINVTKTGIGATMGTRGAHYSVHSSGRRTTTVGLPGTGLYYQESKKVGTPHSTPRSVQRINGLTPSQAIKQHERHEKKVQLAAERRSKPLELLKTALAEGKISEKKFYELSQRDNDITLDFIIFGQTPALKLSARYIVGAIDKEEFERVKHEIVGPSEDEKQMLVDGLQRAIGSVKEFAAKCRAQRLPKFCNNCLKKKGVFTPMSSVLDFQLCNDCKKQFDSLRNYPGYNGQFYTVAPIILSPDDMNNIEFNINRDYVLAYR